MQDKQRRGAFGRGRGQRPFHAESQRVPAESNVLTQRQNRREPAPRHARSGQRTLPKLARSDAQKAHRCSRSDPAAPQPRNHLKSRQRMTARGEEISSMPKRSRPSTPAIIDDSCCSSRPCGALSVRSPRGQGREMPTACGPPYRRGSPAEQGGHATGSEPGSSKNPRTMLTRRLPSVSHAGGHVADLQHCREGRFLSRSRVQQSHRSHALNRCKSYISISTAQALTLHLIW